jgi:hypothetical protein
MTTWLKGARDAGTARGLMRVRMALLALSADEIGADDQDNAEHQKQDGGDHQVPGGGFIILIRIHVLVPLRVFIK